MKKSINDQLIEIYYFVDEFSKHHPEFAQWRESNNSAPKFSDAEVITIALMQGYFGCATLSRTYQLVAANASSAFPFLCSYKQWLARLHAVSPLIGLLVLGSSVRPREEIKLFSIDSKPIPVCHRLRHGRVRLLRQDGAYFSKSTNPVPGMDCGIRSNSSCFISISASMASLRLDQPKTGVYIKAGLSNKPEKQAIDCELITGENAEQFGLFGRK